MKDIQSLLRRAKFGGPAELASYTEAVQTIRQSDPVAYLSELEYIISSGVGMESLKTFMSERTSLPLVATRAILESAEMMMEKTSIGATGSAGAYDELRENAIDRLDRYEHLMAMFEAFEADMPMDYLTSALDDRLGYRQALDRFGAGAIPDSLLGCFGGTVTEVMENASNHLIFSAPGMRQWLVEAASDLIAELDPMVVDHVTDGSLGDIVSGLTDKSNEVYREAVLTDQDLQLMYTEANVKALDDYVAFQEYMVTAVRTDDSILSANMKAYQAYHELDGLVPEDESCSDIAAMLPTGQRVIAEARDHKTGRIPEFIGRNHDLNYGEDDTKLPSGEKPDPYAKPKVSTDDQLLDDTPTGNVVDDDRDTRSTGISDVSNGPNPQTNYTYNYYDSFNRSHRDDHSNHSNVSHRDSSSHSNISDDHSTGKRIRSDDNIVDHKVESGNSPWQLDIGDELSAMISDEMVQTEGFKETITKMASKAVSALKGLFTMKQTLGNLQLLDTPAMLSARTSPVIPGTGIPIFGGKIGSQPIREAYDSETAISDLLDQGYSFTESVDARFGMSKNDVKNVVNRLRSRFKAEILFISNNNYTVSANIGPASVISTDRATLNKILKGKQIDRLPSPMYDEPSSDFETVILINPKIMADYKISTPGDLELIIAHEYGHVLTFDQLTQRDWMEYATKRQILNGLIGWLYLAEEQAVAESNMIYYQLKPEALANKALHLDPAALTYAFLHRRATGKLDKLNMSCIVTWKVPDLIISQAIRSAKGVTTFTNAELMENLKFTAELYKKVITDPSRRKEMLDQLNDRILKLSKLSPDEPFAFFESYNDALIPGTRRDFKLFPPWKKKPQPEPEPPVDTHDDLLKRYSEDRPHFKITPGDLTDDEITAKLTSFLADRYHADEGRVIDLVEKLAEDEHKILGNVVTEPNLDTMWTDLYHIEEMLLGVGENVVFEADNGETFFFEHIVGKNDYQDGDVTLEKLNEVLDQHGIPRDIIPKELFNRDITEWGKHQWGVVAASIFDHHSFPMLTKLQLPEGAKLVQFYDDTDWDGPISANLIFTDINEEIDTFNKDLGTGGSIEARFQPGFVTEGFDNPLASSFEQISDYIENVSYNSESASGDEPDDDPERPTSDHPVKDTVQDIDRILTRKGAEAKKKANDIINVGKVIAKPVKRTIGWIDNLINRFKDADETKLKEELTDPRKRGVVFKAISFSIKTGALYKAGLLLNPIFLLLAVTNTINKRRNNARLRADVIGQLKAEIEVIDEKIKDADRAGDNGAKYKLMRFKTEISKKLARVSGGKEARRIL